MAFSHRMAALAAVVAIPLGIAATSYALTESPDPPKSPPKVELESGSPSSRPTPSDETVSPPPVSENPSADDSTAGTDDSDDDGNDGNDGADDRGGADDDGPGDDG
ncbi:small secreted hydrophilic protein [Streptomyces sp. NPDC006422]|uniref:small secreted hydrophilic protein n=1 Tax=unclassified Streptomyces TaxID=2593676 RepID=UPI0033AE3CA6